MQFYCYYYSFWWVLSPFGFWQIKRKFQLEHQENDINRQFGWYFGSLCLFLFIENASFGAGTTKNPIACWNWKHEWCEWCSIAPTLRRSYHQMNILTVGLVKTHTRLKHGVNTLICRQIRHCSHQQQQQHSNQTVCTHTDTQKHPDSST